MNYLSPPRWLSQQREEVKAGRFDSYKKIDVSVIIVSFNTKEKTHKCIASLYKFTKHVEIEIIVSDNGSTDHSVEDISMSFPDVIIIENGKNLGFAKANNIALKRASGKYIFYLNSDTYLCNNSIKMFFDYWEQNDNKKKIGALGGQLFDTNMNFIHSGAAFPTYKQFCIGQLKANMIFILRAIYRFLGKDESFKKISAKRKCSLIWNSQEGEIDYITGADLFLLNNEDAVFNEEYFMYYEETELELKLKEKGLQRIIIPGPKIVHDRNAVRTDGKIVVYKKTDYFGEKSRIVYSINNLHTNAIILKLLVMLNGINPYVKKVRSEVDANKCAY